MPILDFRTPSDVQTNVLTGMTGNERGVAGSPQTYRVYNDFDGVGTSTARLVKLYVFFQMESGGLYRSSSVEPADQQWMEAKLSGVTFDLDGAPSDDKTSETTNWTRFGGRTAFNFPGSLPESFGRELLLRLHATGSGGALDINDIRIALAWDRGIDGLDTGADDREGRGICVPGGQENFLLAGKELQGARVKKSDNLEFIFFVDDNASGGSGEVMTISPLGASAQTFTEGVDFNVGATEALTADDLRDAINTRAMGVLAYRKDFDSGTRAAVVLRNDTVRIFSIASDTPAFIEAGNIDNILIAEDMSFLNPQEQYIETIRQESIPINETDGSGVELASSESFVVDVYRNAFTQVYRFYMVASAEGAPLIGIGETANVRVGNVTNVLTGVAAAPAANEFVVGPTEADTASNLATAINGLTAEVSAAASTISGEEVVTCTATATQPLFLSTSEPLAWLARNEDFTIQRGDLGTPGEPPASPGADYIHLARTSRAYGSGGLTTVDAGKAIHDHATMISAGTSAIGSIGAYIAMIGGVILQDPSETDFTHSGAASTRNHVKLNALGAVTADAFEPGLGDIYLGISQKDGSGNIDFLQDRSWMHGPGTRLTRIRRIKEFWHVGADASLDDEAYMFGFFAYLQSGTLPLTITDVSGNKVSALCTTFAAGEQGILEFSGTELYDNCSEGTSMTEEFMVTAVDQWSHGRKRWLGTSGNTNDVTIDSTLALGSTTAFDAYAADLFTNEGRPFVIKSLKLTIVHEGHPSAGLVANLVKVPAMGALETIYTATKGSFAASSNRKRTVLFLARTPTSPQLPTQVPIHDAPDRCVINPWKGEGIYLKLSSLIGIISVGAELVIDERLKA